MVAKTTATTVTLKHLAAALAADHEIPKKQAEGMLNDLVGMMVKHLKKGCLLYTSPSPRDRG